MDNQKSVPQPHQAILQDRKVLELSGVEDVDSFDDMSVLAYTSLGRLTVNGHGLHIRHLDLSSGSLSVEGQIDSLQYSEASHAGGFFSRLFR